MDEQHVRGFPVEILSLSPGESEGEPVAMLTIRAHPEHLRPVTFFFERQQVLFIRNALDKYLNDPECCLYVHADRGAKCIEDAPLNNEETGIVNENDDVSDEELLANTLDGEDRLDENAIPCEDSAWDSIPEDDGVLSIDGVLDDGTPKGPKSLMIDVSGPSCSPRYCITDTAGNYWTGRNWNKDRRKACLFHRTGDVGETLHLLMLNQVPGELSKFVIPLVIVAKSETPFDLDTLSAWLAKAMQVGINADQGTGPVPNSMAMIQIQWSQLEEL